MWKWAVFNFVLFFVLTPGVLLTLPKGGSHQTVALTHALVFAVVHHFLCRALKKFYVESIKRKCGCMYY
jgi:hypothetical protein